MLEIHRIKRVFRVVKDFLFPEYWIAVDWVNAYGLSVKHVQHRGKNRADAFDWMAQYPAECEVTVFRNYDVIAVRGHRQ